MAYLLGTAASENDLLSQFVTWLASLGWAVNMAPTVNGAAGGMRAHIQKSGMFVNLQAANGDVDLLPDSGGAPAPWHGFGVYQSDGYDGTQPFLTQPGGPMDLAPMRSLAVFVTKNFPQPFGRFFFFSDALDNVVAVIERRSLNFTHLGFGPALAKSGAYSDGRYFFSEYWRSAASYGTDDTAGGGINADCPFVSTGGANGFVRADVDSFTGKWLACTPTSGGNTGNAGKKCYTGMTYPGGAGFTDIPIWTETGGFLRLAPSTLNSQAVLVPVDIYTARDAGGSSLIGSLPNIFLCNAVGHGFGPATEFDIGSDAYMLFHGATPQNGSQPGFGYAIKKQ
jgi:hypothetical protein